MVYPYMIGGGVLFLFCLCYALDGAFSGHALSRKERTRVGGAAVGAVAGWLVMFVTAVNDAAPPGFEWIGPAPEPCSVTIATPKGQEPQRIDHDCSVTITLVKG